MQGWGACEHLRASVCLRVPTRSDISLEGRGRRWAAAQAQPSPARKEVDFTAPSVFPGTFQGKRHRGHQPLSVCPGPSLHRGFRLRAAQDPGCRRGCCPEVSVHATQAHVITCLCEHINTHISHTTTHTHDYSLHIYTCNCTHVISHTW